MIRVRAIAISIAFLALTLPCALAQVPGGQVAPGEGRLPTPSPTPNQSRPGGDDCRRQGQVVREQFDLQQRAVRKEIAERERQANDTEKQRLRAEMEQRLAALRAEAAEAERRVKSLCQG